MNCYARFYEDLKDNNDNLLYIKDNGRNKTRYAIRDEDYTHYYISMKPNDINYNIVTGFKKEDEGKIYFLSEEV